jgi:acyl-CoA thioester hydrolase
MLPRPYCLELPIVPPRVSRVEFRVRYAETDQMGVAYHANYLVWCEIGRTDHIRTLGTSYREMEEQGIILAVSEASLRFIASAKYDDMIRVETSLSRATSRVLTFDYVITNADTGTKLATASTSLISIDRSGRVSAFPADVRARLAAGVGDAK